ncbi:MAG TPA: chemotaxis protein CheB [Pseudomonas sp.]|nr:chemotaxis protein CheB [Pseudomonas sp.]
MTQHAWQHPFVVIGTSRGGLEALKSILSELPADFPAPVLVAMHVGTFQSRLPELLAPVCELKVRHATDEQSIEPGTVLVAPPDRHMLVDGNNIRLTLSAKENFCRPAIDPLFRSAAISHRERVIGVLLTGDLDDGTVGLQAIKACGGIALVQDPAEADAPSMPSSAIAYVRIDACLPSPQIADHLMSLVREPRSQAGSEPTRTMVVENEISLGRSMDSISSLDQVAPRSAVTCPECRGVLWEMDSAPLRYRCHTGHAYGPSVMLSLQDQSIEEGLWAAVRAFHEKEVLMTRQREAATANGRHEQAREYEMIADQTRRNAHSLRQLLQAAIAEKTPDTQA